MLFDTPWDRDFGVVRIARYERSNPVIGFAPQGESNPSTSVNGNVTVPVGRSDTRAASISDYSGAAMGARASSTTLMASSRVMACPSAHKASNSSGWMSRKPGKPDGRHLSGEAHRTPPSRGLEGLPRAGDRARAQDVPIWAPGERSGERSVRRYVLAACARDRHVGVFTAEARATHRRGETEPPLGPQLDLPLQSTTVRNARTTSPTGTVNCRLTTFDWRYGAQSCRSALPRAARFGERSGRAFCAREIPHAKWHGDVEAAMFRASQPDPVRELRNPLGLGEL